MFVKAMVGRGWWNHPVLIHWLAASSPDEVQANSSNIPCSSASAAVCASRATLEGRLAHSRGIVKVPSMQSVWLRAVRAQRHQPANRAALLFIMNEPQMELPVLVCNVITQICILAKPPPTPLEYP